MVVTNDGIKRFNEIAKESGSDLFAEQPEEVEENGLTSMFADIEMKLKAIAETLQQQIEEIRQRIEALEKK